jgi:hypothetical protein
MYYVSNQHDVSLNRKNVCTKKGTHKTETIHVIHNDVYDDHHYHKQFSTTKMHALAWHIANGFINRVHLTSIACDGKAHASVGNPKRKV